MKDEQKYSAAEFKEITDHANAMVTAVEETRKTFIKNLLENKFSEEKIAEMGFTAEEIMKAKLK